VGGFTARMQPLTLPGRGESNKIEPRDSDGGRKSRQADRQESRSPSRRVQRAGLAFREALNWGTTRTRNTRPETGDWSLGVSQAAAVAGQAAMLARRLAATIWQQVHIYSAHNLCAVRLFYAM
jgi:hypothetical protein